MVGINRKNYLGLIVHLAAWGVVIWTLVDYYLGNLTVNPLQAATQRTGKTALIFLVLALACTPVNTLFGFRQVLSIRRALGLYAFMFAGIHFFIFIGLDYGFDWGLLWLDLSSKRYIWVGAAALSILTPLAVTSFRWWMKRMGKNWKRLHRLVYLAGGLVIVHYAWAKKGDLFSLQGDVLQPALFGLLVILLLLARIPRIRKWLSQWNKGSFRGRTILSGRPSKQSLS